jgi:hypothetical protein
MSSLSWVLLGVVCTIIVLGWAIVRAGDDDR